MDPVSFAYIVLLIISELLPHVSNHQVNGFLHILQIGIEKVFNISLSKSPPPLAQQVELPEPQSPAIVLDLQKA